MKMNILFILLILFIVGWWTRNLYFRNVVYRYKLRLFTLRDRFRLVAINNEIDKDSTSFDFLDNSISKSIQYLDCLNIYTLAFYSIKLSKDKDYKSWSHWISKNVENDAVYSDFFNEFNKITHAFIVDRFVISFFVFRILIGYISGYTKVISTISISFHNLSLMMRFLPEVKPIPVFLRSFFL